jgi:hypothetical protein
MRRQTAVYWHPKGYDVNSKPILDDPIEIKCRWDDRSERDLNIVGEMIDVRATVYVDREVALGGVLWLGLLVDAPRTPPESGRIKIFRNHPNLKNSETLRIARL